MKLNVVGIQKNWPKVFKKSSCSTQLSTRFRLLIESKTTPAKWSRTILEEF